MLSSRQRVKMRLLAPNSAAKKKKPVLENRAGFLRFYSLIEGPASNDEAENPELFYLDTIIFDDGVGEDFARDAQCGLTRLHFWKRGI